VLTRARILDEHDVHVVMPDDVPNPNWVRPGSPSEGQQTFGRELLEQHFFVLIPSAVSDESWNLLFNPDRAAGRYELAAQKRFALDTRLNPPS
jgi:RES domain-containing protein